MIETLDAGSVSAGSLQAFRQPLAIVDLETTGGRALQDRITEIGVVLVDADGTRTWSRLINPECRIPPFITQLTGISNEAVANAPRFAEVADELADLLRGRLFIAHNARFDHAFLKAEFERLGRPFPLRTLCTVRLSRILAPEQPRHNLDTLMARYGIMTHRRHRALDDALAVHAFLLRAEAVHGVDAVARAASGIRKRASLPAYLDEALIEALPTGPGVYFFHGEAGLLYVGKAKNIRARVLSHFAADLTQAKEMRLSQQVRRITWEATAGELGALLREARYVKQLQPLQNRQLRRQARLGAMVLRARVDGALQPVYVSGNDLAQERQLYGLFNSRAAMIKHLRTVAGEQGFCDYVMGFERLAARPCPSRQLKRCRGLCESRETTAQHNLRLLQAVESEALKAWPFEGAVVLEESNPETGESEFHLVDNWCWLGSASDEQGLEALREARTAPVLDKDTYRLLVRAIFGSKTLKVSACRV